jgi:AraC family transcriptional regulator, regulatory protein of adaptative response / methylated-DNA-[protein]-cysteine methyltransferase
LTARNGVRVACWLQILLLVEELKVTMISDTSRIRATPAQTPTAAPAAVADLAERWSAVLSRDKQFDGEFVYAVRSTGVYCRPSCPSRPARRENVEFHDTTQRAQAAGFRACKRCQPDGASLEHRHNELITAACRAIEASEAGLALDELAAAAGLSAHHFHRIFKRVTGLTPKAYAKAVQGRRVHDALEGANSVTEAIYDAGFNSSGRFYESSASKLGMAPQQFRSGGVDQQIRYAVEPCALGVIIVAATPRGVCGIEFGDSAHALVERLRQRFPKADFTPGDPSFRAWVGRVLAYIEQPAGVLDLPLDIQGTVFQRRVWQALRDIPCGSTASYAEVAQAIGKPKAVRAVATACASNNVAVAVPCHRVVRSDGSLSGYRWGPERKAELLRRERQE